MKVELGKQNNKLKNKFLLKNSQKKGRKLKNFNQPKKFSSNLVKKMETWNSTVGKRDKKLSLINWQLKIGGLQMKN